MAKEIILRIITPCSPRDHLVCQSGCVPCASYALISAIDFCLAGVLTHGSSLLACTARSSLAGLPDQAASSVSSSVPLPMLALFELEEAGLLRWGSGNSSTLETANGTGVARVCYTRQLDVSEVDAVAFGAGTAAEVEAVRRRRRRRRYAASVAPWAKSSGLSGLESRRGTRSADAASVIAFTSTCSSSGLVYCTHVSAASSHLIDH